MSSGRELSRMNRRRRLALPNEQTRFSHSVQEAMRQFRAKNRPKKVEKKQPSLSSFQGPVKQVDEKCRVIPWPAREIV